MTLTGARPAVGSPAGLTSLAPALSFPAEPALSNSDVIARGIHPPDPSVSV